MHYIFLFGDGCLARWRLGPPNFHCLLEEAPARLWGVADALCSGSGKRFVQNSLGHGPLCCCLGIQPEIHLPNFLHPPFRLPYTVPQNPDMGASHLLRTWGPELPPVIWALGSGGWEFEEGLDGGWTGLLCVAELFLLSSPWPHSGSALSTFTGTP